MYLKAEVKFGDLPEHIQQKHIEQNDLDWAFSHHPKGFVLHRSRANTNDRGLPSSDTLFTFELDNVIVPFEWLEKLNCSIELNDTFIGELPNGVFRFGPLKAEVTSFVDKGAIYGGPETKVTIVGEGPGAVELAIKFYSQIRSGKLKEENTIESWDQE